VVQDVEPDLPLAVHKGAVRPWDRRNASCGKLSVDRMCHLGNSRKWNAEYMLSRKVEGKTGIDSGHFALPTQNSYWKYYICRYTSALSFTSITT